jgi:hypothetical protein
MSGKDVAILANLKDTMSAVSLEELVKIIKYPSHEILPSGT